MKLSLKKEVQISGFGEETGDSVYQAFEEFTWDSDRSSTPLPKHLKIYYADYTYECYSGDAYVLGYNKDLKKWFEVHGSHCSCYGLEDQWEEEYYDTEGQLLEVFAKRFEAQDGYERCAYSSDEFLKWLKK